MKIFNLIKLYLIILIICLFPSGLFAYEMDDCIFCHSDNPGDGIPQISVEEYKSSIHGSMMECSECHSYIEEGHEAGGAAGEVNCGECHSQENLHGLSSGKDNKPECYSCHTKHKILSGSDKNSSINKSRLKITCKICHPAEWGERGYLEWFISVRVKSHKKQDFTKEYEETNCIGCHQGMAVHGRHEKISDDDCFKCHIKEDTNAMLGRFHTSGRSGSFITGISIVTQLLVLAVLFFFVRFIIKPLSKSGKGEE